MSKYGQLAKNTILIGVGSFSSKLLTFLCVPLYTALLTTEQYGLADIITTVSYTHLKGVGIVVMQLCLRW